MVSRILSHTASEFLSIAPYLLLGALASSVFKVFTPSSVVSLLSSNLTLAVVGMMILAVLLSICSEADAFVAASFSTLPSVAKLSFITLGPMVDLKLIFMFFSAFDRRVALMLIIPPTVMIYTICMILGMTWT